MNQPNKTYYKITNRTDAGHFSFNSGGLARGLEPSEVRYGLGVRSVPKIAGTKLFVFVSPQHARDFLRRCGYNPNYIELGFNLWECHAENVGRPKYIADGMINILTFWKGKARKKKLNGAKRAPSGTLSADAVTLVREIPLWG